MQGGVVRAQLTGIVPASAVQGQHLQTTITSNGLFLQSITPCGNIHRILLVKGVDYVDIFNINSFGSDVTVLNDDSLKAYFQIPDNAVPGVYDLIVETGDTLAGSSSSASYTITGGYNISVPDGFITGNAYDDLNKNGIKEAGESGLRYRTITCLPHEHVFLTDVNGNYSFPVANGNYNIVAGNSYWQPFMFPTTPGNIPVTINNNNSPGNDFGLKNALYSITPDTVYRGVTTLHRFISDEPIFIPGAAASGNVYLARVFTSPSVNVSASSNSIFVIDSFTVDILLKIPAFAALNDSIDAVIETHTIPPYASNQHFLRRKLTVVPAEGAISGILYHDLNKNGIQDSVESVIPYGKIKVGPDNYTVTADASGYFFIPVQNGDFTLTAGTLSNDYLFTTSADTLFVTVNNDTVTGNDFGMASALISIVPDTAYQGISTTHIVTADKPIFMPPAGGNISNVTVLSSPSFNVSVFSLVSIIDSFTVQLKLNVPINTAAGNNVDIRFYLNSGHQGYHFLKQKLNIAPPQGFVYGNVFFDQNQNKINDPGEGSISGMKVELTPELNFAISDSAGNYQIASQGGPQTLAPAGNINGLVLNTDSASYTFIASGTVTGKDFGYISSYSDYSIDVRQLYIFPRCFTPQNASFKLRNISNIPYDVMAWMKYDTSMNYLSASPPPSMVSNDTIYWNLTNVAPFVDVTFNALLQMPGPGNNITLKAGASSLNGSGIIQLSDSLSRINNVVCAFDPNDKQVVPPGIFAQNYTLMTDTLDFLIRFQNTGNDTAFKVVILDTLDSDLNFGSFEIIGNSHSLQTQVSNNGAVRFEFDNILLPDSNVNEPGSHGYINYRVRAKNGLPNETNVNNTAYIFFDFNPAVVTNTTLNTMVYVLPTGVDEVKNEFSTVLYPNPFNTTATLQFDNPQSMPFSLSIYDIAGRQILPAQHTTGSSLTIDATDLPQGFYFYHLRNRNGMFHSGTFVVN